MRVSAQASYCRSMLSMDHLLSPCQSTLTFPVISPSHVYEPHYLSGYDKMIFPKNLIGSLPISGIGQFKIFNFVLDLLVLGFFLFIIRLLHLEGLAFIVLDQDKNFPRALRRH